MTKKRIWTPAEREYVLSELETRTQREVAEELGVALEALESRVRHWRRMGRAGKPEATTPAHVHEGLELKAQSTRTADEDGTLRWDKTGLPLTEPEPIPDHLHVTRVSTLQRNGLEVLRWTAHDEERAAREAATRAAVLDFVANHVRPAEPLPVPAHNLDDLKTYYPIGDAHVGMLAWGEEVGESFDLKIASTELTECVRQLVARSPASRTAEVTNLGDWWHAQNTRATTPASGNSLDVDGRYGKVVRVGIGIGVSLVEAALLKHERVAFRTLRGNHDPEQSLWLAEVLRAYFRNEPRVYIEEAHKFYQFDLFGRNLVMWCHGDGAKPEQLPQVMLAQGAQWISQTKFRFGWSGHVHSRNAAEYGGMLWESFNTLAGKDAWHAWKGYNALQRLQAVTLHREWGEDFRATVGVERVRAAIEAMRGAA
jgi:hypothetical protein